MEKVEAYQCREFVIPIVQKVDLDKANVGAKADIDGVAAIITEHIFYAPESKRIRIVNLIELYVPVW